MREIIAQSYAQKDGLNIDADRIIITTGSQQALDLLGKVFVNAGEDVLVERPTYLAAIQALQFYEPHFIEIPLLHDGPDVKSLPSAPPSFVYTIPNFQNPTGLTWSNKKRADFAQWAAKMGTVIVEDDPYGEIRFTGERQKPLLSFYPQTILLGSFSKILAPGLRLGWIVAPNQDIYDALLVAKQSADLHSSQFTQLIAAQFYRTFDAQKHIATIARAYRTRKDALRNGLKKIFSSAEITNPDGGMFLWVQFDPSVNTTDFLEVALENGVAFVPGSPFYVHKPAANTARFNFSHTDDAIIAEGLARLERAWKNYKAKFSPEE